jgi:mRNA-degrading endonuclease RelE of RelBE toxin-antitoxin system
MAAIFVVNAKRQFGVPASSISTSKRSRDSIRKNANGAAANLWRIRVRDYRIIHTLVSSELIVTIVKIWNRKEVYR